MSSLHDIVIENGYSTFSNEDSLPKLPLPKLETTLTRLAEGLKPFQYADSNYQHPLDPVKTSELALAIDNFLNSTAAKKLQAKLEEFHRSSACYLDKLHFDINNHMAEKELSQDILPRNPFLILADDTIDDVAQEARAGVLCFSALRFVSALRRRVLSPDCGNDGEPRSMTPYMNLFGTTRCPVFESGEVESFDLNKPYSESDVDAESKLNRDLETLYDPDATRTPTAGSDDIDEQFNRHGINMKQYPESRHVLIISRGQYYTLEVLDEKFHLLYNHSDLSDIFLAVLDDSKKSYGLERSTALGSLTSYSFKNWKYARKRLQKRFPNELEMIDSALFVIVLDESDNKDDWKNSFAKRIFYGTSVIDDATGLQVGSCKSRWYDKLQLVITADAKAGIIWDSFTCDGSIILRFASDIYAESVLRLAIDVHDADPKFSLWPKVEVHRILRDDEPNDKYLKKIEWSFSNVLNTHVHLSETKLTDIISKHDIITYRIPFGRRTAQKLGVRADSMIQVALQIAHYALYGKIIFSLEPISIRAFKNSKSTFILVQSSELLELCQQFISNSLTELEKFEKFLHACQVHSLSIVEAQDGLAIEKHCYALRHLFKFNRHFGVNLTPEEVKCASALFDCVILERIYSPELIASNCGNIAMSTFGVTPAVPYGFGIGYIVKHDQTDITVTSQYRQGTRFMFMLEWVLTEIYEYWKLARDSNGGEGIKISPAVDMLYELDDAMNSSKHPSNPTKPNFASGGGYGLFDLKGHIESRSSASSTPITRAASPLNIADLLTTLSLHKVNISLSTSDEKLTTGCEIKKLDPPSSSSRVEGNDTEPAPRKSNVINSRFIINFNRSSCGRKIDTID
ncbi:carnitine O-acetyltransferase YAT2 Ecym_7201 [Eremothecium cymbalariae DBVPG|uniref:Choline/carnitine acyltransferase domain-containing protein n=1 Tax=Eremothecium cymbalariae (strain CBS 270.75 / DBVPG 7215 / KCTC 17166 / NRRL Y-17582) TaxID=931890 RepID=G8JW34_ERECY|nr:hypothetical protein Ecym_7201 [Eremothecium cymbalariae DBVPG\